MDAIADTSRQIDLAARVDSLDEMTVARAEKSKQVDLATAADKFRQVDLAARADKSKWFD